MQNPSDGNAAFTNDGAWELVAIRLESGHEVEIIELKKPRGAKGYVMKIHLESSRPLLYVKLELHRGWIHGRSFHYSER